MKKILFGALWSIVIYILLWILFAVIYYLYVGGDYASFEEGYSHGADAGTKLGEMGGRIFIIIISIVLASILTYKGMLPGTKEITAISSSNKYELETVKFGRSKFITIADGMDVKEINLWSSTFSRGKIVASMKNGEEIVILKDEDPYYLVESANGDGRKGYCLKNYITLMK